MLTVGNIPVEVVDNEVRYEAGAQIDGDGSPRCYALPSSGLIGLDNIRNALVDPQDDPRNPIRGWCGVVTINGKPYVQPDGPNKGFCLSPTALQDRTFPITDPRRYVDAETIPYISIPPELHTTCGVQLGDGALVADRDTGLSVQAIVADVGPRRKLGEISIACARAIGIPASPRNGGAGRGVIVRIFLGSAKTPPWDARRGVTEIAMLVDAFASRSA